MPAFSTHYIFARELMKDIKELADFEIDEDAVLFGSQGPDVFFFHRALPWMIGKPLREVGNQLHRAPASKIFDALREYILFSKNESIAKSFAYGMMLHYALDRKCHPYVYFLQYKMVEKNPKLNSGTVHNTIEFAMDSYLVNKKLGIDEPTKYDTASTVNLKKTTVDEVAKEICYIVNKVIDYDLSIEDSTQALLDMKYVQKATTDPTDVKKKILGPFETAISPITKGFKFTAMMRHDDIEEAKKYGNLNHKEWTSPYSNEKSTDSFEDLFDKAKIEAMSMLKRYQNGDDTYKITNNLSFLTGVEVE